MVFTYDDEHVILEIIRIEAVDDRYFCNATFILKRVFDNNPLAPQLSRNAFRGREPSRQFPR